MALSGSVQTNTGTDGRYYKLEWTATQSITNNTSTISWTLSACGGKTSTEWIAERTLYVIIDGDTVYSKESMVQRRAGTIISGNKLLTHGSDGTKSFKITIGAAVYYSTVNCTGETTFTLDTVPRASDLSVSNGTLESPLTINADRKSSSFTHTVTWLSGSYSGTIATKSSSTSWSFTPSENLAHGAPNGNRVYCEIKLETFSGNTSVGSVTKSIWLTIPDNSRYLPTITDITLTEPSGQDHISKYGSWVEGKSKINVNISCNGNYGATIKSYSTSANGIMYYTKTFTADAIKTIGLGSITSTVTDSRGRSNSYTKTYGAYAYESPKITKLSVRRCNSDGTENANGEYAQVSVGYSITSLDNNNSKSIIVEYKKKSENSYTRLLTLSSSYTEESHDSSIFYADTGSVYDIYVSVSDDFERTVTRTTLSTGFCLFNVRNTGKGIAFGGVSTADNFTFNMPIVINKGVEGFVYISDGYFSDSNDDLRDAINSYLGTMDYSTIAPAFILTYNWGTDLEHPFAGYICKIGDDNAYLLLNDEYGHRVYGTKSTNAWTFTHDNIIQVDYIVSQGTTNNWKWRKWNSGRCELWHMKWYPVTKVANSYGGLYRTDLMYTENLPFTVSNHVITATCNDTNCMIGNVWKNSSSGSSDIQFRIISPTSSSSCSWSIGCSFYVSGNWK